MSRHQEKGQHLRRRKNKSSAKRSKRKRSRDSSEVRDQTFECRVTRSRYKSPIPEEATVNEAQDESNEATRAAQSACGSDDGDKGTKVGFARGLGLQRPMLTRRELQEAATAQGSPPPKLSPQASAEPYNTRSPSGRVPVLEKEGVKKDGEDTLGNSSNNEDNNVAFENHENDDSSADESPKVKILFSREHFSQTPKRKRRVSKKVPTAADSPPPPDPPKRRRQSSPISLPGSPKEQERDESRDPEQAGPSHSVAAMVKIKVDACQPEEQEEKIEENDIAWLGFLDNPITVREILEEYTQEEYNILLKVARKQFGVELPGDDKDATIHVLARLWKSCQDFPDAPVTLLHKRCWSG